MGTKHLEASLTNPMAGEVTLPFRSTLALPYLLECLDGYDTQRVLGQNWGQMRTVPSAT